MEMVESAKNASVNVNKNHVTISRYIHFLLNSFRIPWDIVGPGFHILHFDDLFVVSIFSMLNYANICKNKTFLLVVWMLMIPRGLSSVIPPRFLGSTFSFHSNGASSSTPGYNLYVCTFRNSEHLL